MPVYHEYAGQAAACVAAAAHSRQAGDHRPPADPPNGRRRPEKLKPEEWKIYNLVARRFIATLSGDAVVEGTKAVLEVGGEPFVAKGDVLSSRASARSTRTA